MRPRRPHASPFSTVGRAFAVLWVVILVGLPLGMAGAGAASGPPSSSSHASTASTGSSLAPADAPTTNGCYFSTRQGYVVSISANEVLGSTTVCQGTFVYGDSISVEFINFGYNRTLTFVAAQSNGPNTTRWTNVTLSIPQDSLVVFPVTLSSVPTTWNVKACIDGGCVEFTHATPLLFLPSGVLNIGGVDLLAFSIALLTFILVLPLLFVARWIARKAYWWPSGIVGLGLAVPHVVAFFLFGIAVDFQWFNQTFSGWEFIVFPVVFAVIIFYGSIHLFNVAKPKFAFRPDPMGYHDLEFHGWKFFVATLPNGDVVLIGKRLRDAIARCFGHHNVLKLGTSKNTDQGAAYELNLKMHQFGYRARPTKKDPLQGFRVMGALDMKHRDPPDGIYFVDHDVDLDDTMPRLKITRVVKVPRYDKEGNLVEERSKRKFTLPYYVDPAPNAIGLAGIHIVDQIAAAVGFISYEELTRKNEELQVQIGRLRASMWRLIQEASDRVAADAFRLYERDVEPLTEEQRREEALPVLSKERPKPPGGGTSEKPSIPSPSEGRVSE